MGAGARARRRHDAMAQATARALVAAEMRGHRLPRRLAHPAVLRPPAQRPRQAAPRCRWSRATRRRGCLVDAKRRARVRGVRARGQARRSGARSEFGVAFVAVTNSNHFGVAAYHLEPHRARRARRARVRQFAGGDAGVGRQARALRHQPDRRGVPAARRGAARRSTCRSPTVVRGKIMVAAREGKPIPEGWALDARRPADHRCEGGARPAACCPSAA